MTFCPYSRYGFLYKTRPEGIGEDGLPNYEPISCGFPALAVTKGSVAIWCPDTQEWEAIGDGDPGSATTLDAVCEKLEEFGLIPPEGETPTTIEQVCAKFETAGVLNPDGTAVLGSIGEPNANGGALVTMDNGDTKTFQCANTYVVADPVDPPPAANGTHQYVCDAGGVLLYEVWPDGTIKAPPVGSSGNNLYDFSTAGDTYDPDSPPAAPAKPANLEEGFNLTQCFENGTRLYTCVGGALVEQAFKPAGKSCVVILADGSSQPAPTDANGATIIPTIGQTTQTIAGDAPDPIPSVPVLATPPQNHHQHTVKYDNCIAQYTTDDSGSNWELCLFAAKLPDGSTKAFSDNHPCYGYVAGEITQEPKPGLYTRDGAKFRIDQAGDLRYVGGDRDGEIVTEILEPITFPETSVQAAPRIVDRIFECDSSGKITESYVFQDDGSDASGETIVKGQPRSIQPKVNLQCCEETGQLFIFDDTNVPGDVTVQSAVLKISDTVGGSQSIDLADPLATPVDPSQLESPDAKWDVVYTVTLDTGEVFETCDCYEVTCCFQPPGIASLNAGMVVYDEGDQTPFWDNPLNNRLGGAIANANTDFANPGGDNEPREMSIDLIGDKGYCVTAQGFDDPSDSFTFEWPAGSDISQAPANLGAAPAKWAAFWPAVTVTKTGNTYDLVFDKSVWLAVLGTNCKLGGDGKVRIIFEAKGECSSTVVETAIACTWGRDYSVTHQAFTGLSSGNPRVNQSQSGWQSTCNGYDRSVGAGFLSDAVAGSEGHAWWETDLANPITPPNALYVGGTGTLAYTPHPNTLVNPTTSAISGQPFWSTNSTGFAYSSSYNIVLGEDPNGWHNQNGVPMETYIDMYTPFPYDVANIDHGQVKMLPTGVGTRDDIRSCDHMRFVISYNPFPFPSGDPSEFLLVNDTVNFWKNATFVPPAQMPLTVPQGSPINGGTILHSWNKVENGSQGGYDEIDVIIHNIPVGNTIDHPAGFQYLSPTIHKDDMLDCTYHMERILDFEDANGVVRTIRAIHAMRAYWTQPHTAI